MKGTLIYDDIIEELKDVPADRLEELYEYVHALAAKPANEQGRKNKIMSYAGIFKSMPDEDYNEFFDETGHTRNNLFNRKINL